MSDNKNKYFRVTTVVSATNKTEAMRAASSARRVPGTQVLSSDAQRIAAIDAHALTATS